MMDSNGSSTVSTSELAAFLAKNMPEIHRSNDEVEALMRVMTGQMASGGDDAVEEDDDDPLAGPMSMSLSAGASSPKPASALAAAMRAKKVASRRSASWLDFRRAMEDWLLSDKDRFALVSEKNLDSGRAKIHTAIQAWFNQFQSGEGMWPAEPELGPGPLEAAEIALADFPGDHSKHAQFETLPLPNLSLQRFSRYDKDEYIDHLGEGDFGPVFARRNTRGAHTAGTATNDKKVVIKIAHLGRGLSLLIAQVGEQVIRLDKLHLIAINSAFVDVAHFDAAIAIADHHGITDINE